MQAYNQKNYVVCYLSNRFLLFLSFSDWQLCRPPHYHHMPDHGILHLSWHFPKCSMAIILCRFYVTLYRICIRLYIWFYISSEARGSTNNFNWVRDPECRHSSDGGLFILSFSRKCSHFLVHFIFHCTICNIFKLSKKKCLKVKWRNIVDTR